MKQIGSDQEIPERLGMTHKPFLHMPYHFKHQKVVTEKKKGAVPLLNFRDPIYTIFILYSTVYHQKKKKNTLLFNPT
jgi:hypothetical protein